GASGASAVAALPGLHYHGTSEGTPFGIFNRLLKGVSFFFSLLTTSFYFVGVNGAEQCGKGTLASPRAGEPHAAGPLSLAVFGSECRRKETFPSSRRKPLLVELAISCNVSVHALY